LLVLLLTEEERYGESKQLGRLFKLSIIRKYLGLILE
jgi:hypothetical protein